MKKTSITDVNTIEIPIFRDVKGDLIAVEHKTHLPIEIKRVFQIIAPKGSVRGEHAHISHTQFMICTFGKIKIECDDGQNIKDFILEKPSIGILVPPNIWSKQTYLEENSILTVLCDENYNEDEYVRDYQKFLKVKKI